MKITVTYSSLFRQPNALLRFFSSYSGYSNFEFLDSLVPVLGTIGLILIVLEAALELEIKKEKKPRTLWMRKRKVS